MLQVDVRVQQDRRQNAVRELVVMSTWLILLGPCHARAIPQATASAYCRDQRCAARNDTSNRWTA
jgi:hypothetical protein